MDYLSGGGDQRRWLKWTPGEPRRVVEPLPVRAEGHEVHVGLLPAALEGPDGVEVFWTGPSAAHPGVNVVPGFCVGLVAEVEVDGEVQRVVPLGRALMVLN